MCYLFLFARDKISNMKKIMIVGPCGSGKSTLSRKLRDDLHLPLYHLDNIFWKKDRTHLSHKELDEKINEIIKQDEWIIDGDYSYNYLTRMEACDTIIFLDFSCEDCLKAVESRVGQKRSDMPWDEEEFTSDFRNYIIDWFSKTRSLLLLYLVKYRNQKDIRVFHNRMEVEKAFFN